MFTIGTAQYEDIAQVRLHMLTLEGLMAVQVALTGEASQADVIQHGRLFMSLHTRQDVADMEHGLAPRCEITSEEFIANREAYRVADLPFGFRA